MFDFLLATNIFIIAGYTFSAFLLLILWAFFRKRLPIKSLAEVSNAVVAFYALCWVLLCIAEFIRISHMGDFGRYRGALLESKFLSCLIITVAVAIPFLRKRPLWLLAPIGIILNYGNIILLMRSKDPAEWQSSWAIQGGSDTNQILWGLESQRPFVLPSIGLAYCLFLFLLYLLAVWAKKFAHTPQ